MWVTIKKDKYYDSEHMRDGHLAVAQPEVVEIHEFIYPNNSKHFIDQVS